MTVTIVGIGMGNPDTLTVAAWKALAGADCIIGARRMVDSLPREFTACRHAEIAPGRIADYLDAHPEYERVCVAMSGDVGFYSGARALYGRLEGRQVDTVCGVSSVQYLAARLRRPWQDMRLVSAHGVSCDVAAHARCGRETFFLTGGTITAGGLCQSLCDGGLGGLTATVGENLSYPDERVTSAPARELAGRAFAPLSVVLVDNPRPLEAGATFGLSDGAFIRGDTPMTKSEVRAVSLSRLAVAEADVAYDVGAGTGSVAVELARLARRGRVYAVESQADACALIERNKAQFGLSNLTCVHGMAPQALHSLPPPDCAFIGGSKGNMQGILGALLDKNPGVRVVVNAIALETVAQTLEAMRALGFAGIEVSQLAVSRAKRAGPYHMMMGQNPVYVISGAGGSHGA